LLELPIASGTSLRAALKRMAEVMDRDEDVLVLFLTSHGSDKHQLSLNLWPMSFHELDPPALRAALDETGIRNRVVIVSACYSGGFVRPLEGPGTLVITAAAAGQTSFGCSDEAEWTYFGRAYFDEALRKTYSFAEAFELARPAIAAREKSGKFEPSNPQISIGAAIAPRLELLAAQREGRAGAAAPDGPAAVAQPDRYREYVNLMFADDYLSEMRAVCEQTMVLSSPETSVKADPRLFQGLEKSPRHWGRVKAAWARYAETSCRRMNEPALVAELYLQKAREVMSESEVAEAIAMLSTPQGARWLARDREAVRRQLLELGRAQAAISNELYKTYVDELGATFVEFQKKAD
jgi:hypothetical protein